MNSKRPNLNALLGLGIPKGEAETDSSAPSSEHDDDVLQRLGISVQTTLDPRILTPGKMKKVKFDKTQPSGFSVVQVEKFYKAVYFSMVQLVKAVESRDQDVTRLANELDRALVDAQNYRNQLDVYETVGGIPLKNESGEFVTRRDASEADIALESIQSENSSLKETIARLRAQVAELKSLLNNSEPVDVDDAVNDYKQRIVELQQEVTELRRKLAELGSDSDAVATGLSAVRRPGADLYESEDESGDGESVTLNRAAYENERAELDKWAEEVGAAFSDLEVRFNEAEAELRAAQEEIAAKDEELTSARQEILETQTELSDLRRTAEDRDQQVEELSADLQSARVEISNAYAGIEDRDRSIEGLQEELQSVRSESDQVIDELSSKVDLATIELAEKDAQIDSLQESNNLLTTQINSIRALLAGGMGAAMFGAAAPAEAAEDSEVEDPAAEAVASDENDSEILGNDSGDEVGSVDEADDLDPDLINEFIDGDDSILEIEEDDDEPVEDSAVQDSVPAEDAGERSFLNENSSEDETEAESSSMDESKDDSAEEAEEGSESDIGDVVVVEEDVTEDVDSQDVDSQDDNSEDLTSEPQDLAVEDDSSDHSDHSDAFALDSDNDAAPAEDGSPDAQQEAAQFSDQSEDPEADGAETEEGFDFGDFDGLEDDFSDFGQEDVAAGDVLDGGADEETSEISDVSHDADEDVLVEDVLIPTDTSEGNTLEAEPLFAAQEDVFIDDDNPLEEDDDFFGEEPSSGYSGEDDEDGESSSAEDLYGEDDDEDESTEDSADQSDLAGDLYAENVDLDEVYSEEAPAHDSYQVIVSEETPDGSIRTLSFDFSDLYTQDGTLDESLIDPDRMHFNVDDDSRYASIGDEDEIATHEAFPEDNTVHTYQGIKLPPGIKPEDL